MLEQALCQIIYGVIIMPQYGLDGRYSYSQYFDTPTIRARRFESDTNSHKESLKLKNIHLKKVDTPEITPTPAKSQLITQSTKKRVLSVKEKWERFLKKHYNQKIKHKVKPGETLSHLAYKYHTTVYDIRYLNKMYGHTKIKIGQTITVIPGKKTPKDKRKNLELWAKTGTYIVDIGDSLIGLSKLFKVKKEHIMQMNGLGENDFLKCGEVIILPLPQEDIDEFVEHRKRERLARIEKQKRLEEQKLLEAKKKKEAQRKKLARQRAKRKRLKYTNDKRFKRKIRVIATAYTSHYDQTDSTPFLAAWNNRIRPGMKIIAVSNDLIRKYGLTNGTKVKISGLKDIYVVRDKMNKRLRNHIDIYMGTNRRKALRWGRRSVVLYW